MKTKFNFLLLALVLLIESQAKHEARFRGGRGKGLGFRGGRKGPFFGCECGIAEKGADNAKPNLTAPYNMPMLRRAKKTRIVGGYTPKNRPWMVLIELNETVTDPGPK